jgi:hypothetical protein
LGDAQEREPVETEVVDDGCQVLHPGVERKDGDVVVGQAAAALVVAHERVLAGQADEPVTPHRALPVVVEMGDPVGGPHQRWAGADGGVGEPRAVGCCAEVDLLAQFGGSPERHLLFRIGQLLDGGDEAVPATVDGLDDPLITSAVTDSLAELLDPGGQRRLRDELVPPHDIQQLGLGDHTVSVLDQMSEDVEHLRLDVHQFAATPQLVAGCVQHTALEPVPHRQIVAAPGAMAGNGTRRAWSDRRVASLNGVFG